MKSVNFQEGERTQRGHGGSHKTLLVLRGRAEICLGLQSVIETIKILFHASATIKINAIYHPRLDNEFFM